MLGGWPVVRGNYRENTIRAPGWPLVRVALCKEGPHEKGRFNRTYNLKMVVGSMGVDEPPQIKHVHVSMIQTDRRSSGA